MAKLTEKAKKHRDEFSSGRVGQKFKREVRATSFESLLDRLGLSEDTCHLNEECAAWCRSNSDRRYIPEIVLHRLRAKCLYEETDAPFSLVDNMVIPDTAEQLTEVEDVNEETRTQRKKGEVTNVDAEAILAQSGSVPHKTLPRITLADDPASAPTAPQPEQYKTPTTAEPVKSVRQPAPESEHTPWTRRDKPLVPDQKPLTWFSELEKHCPLP